MNRPVPVIVILTPNTLISLGLKSILEGVLPFGTFKVCSDFKEIESSEIEDYFHLFVSGSYVVKNSLFFKERLNKTIVLMHDEANSAILQEFHQINITASQSEIEASIRGLHKAAHGAPQNSVPKGEKEVLSPREIEVTKLLVEGLINKEIATRLSISTNTVITHRKNIFEKLAIKSVAGLALYAVMKGYIEL